jgi:hypothetical protein
VGAGREHWIRRRPTSHQEENKSGEGKIDGTGRWDRFILVRRDPKVVHLPSLFHPVPFDVFLEKARQSIERERER